jgi:hypothetical protein
MKSKRRFRTIHALAPTLTDPSEPGKPLHLGWRIILTVLLLIAVALIGLLISAPGKASAAPLPQRSGDPLVLAFYYTWFDENTWTYDKLSDLPAQPYVSRDRAAMGRHIDEAKQAGIDGFLVAWYGPDGNQTEANLAALLDEAAARNFKIGILFETDSPFLGGPASISGALQRAGQTHMTHPAYLRVDGRPVVFFWRSSLYSVDAWRGVRSQADPGYSQLWIEEGVDTSYLSVFDGHFLYSNTWNPPADLHYTNQKFADRVRAVAGATGVHKYWVATVMPGYNDVRIRPGSGFATDREGGGYYVRSWQAAMASQPDWVVITSFNEWPEGTYIEPSAAFGRQYLDLTAGWSQQFKGSASPPDPQAGGSIAAASVEALGSQAGPPPPDPQSGGEASQTPPVDPDQPIAYVEASLINLRVGPGTKYEIVGQASAGDALPITGRHVHIPHWWRVDSPAGSGWVYDPLVRVAGSVDDTPMVSE